VKKSLWFLISICSLGLLSSCGGGSSGHPLGVVTHFSITSANASPTAGTPFNITVTALDASGQMVASYSGTVHFTNSNGQPVQPASAAVTNGTGTVSVTLNTAGSQTVTATDSNSITGSTSITVTGVPSPVPLVYQPLSPAAVAPGGAGFTLTVNGTGFVSGSTVKWNGSARTTTFVTESKLTASVPQSDLANAGTASVTVVNPASGGGKSNPVLFEVTNPNGSLFTAAPALPAGSGSRPVATGDFNGDGKVDLAVVNESSDNVSVFLSNGDGTFQAAVNYSVASLPFSIAVGDFNGDGKLDLAVVNNLSDSVSVLLGKGDGTFQPAVNYGVGSTPNSIAVGDFNGDGKLDLAVVNNLSDSVSVLLGKGDGTFQPAVNYGVGSNPTSVAVGDFNGDGKLDLIVGDFVAPNPNLSVLLGIGDGTFQTPVNQAIGMGQSTVAVGDFNGDGKLDVAVAGAGCRRGCPIMQILLGNGDGTFQLVRSFFNPTRNIANSVTLGDFNGDGKLDVLVTYSQPAISVFLGKGDGDFQSPVNYNNLGLMDTSEVATGDFNGDGKLDLAVTSGNGITIMLHQ
jgi:VCBS repeat protein